MQKLYSEIIGLSIKYAQENNQKLLEERKGKIESMRVYQDIFTDVLNYLRYYPESIIMYQRRLSEATFARDQETYAILEHVNMVKQQLQML